MRDDRVRELLDRPAPGEQEAEDRGWQVVRGAFAQRDVPARRARPVRGLIALGAALALIGSAFTPPGQAVTDWVRDTVAPGRDDARPALVSLPAPGRLLVNSQQGPWIVAQDGSRRLLGQYDDASWSPGGFSWPRPAAASWWRWIPGARHGGRSPGRHSFRSPAGRPTGSGSPTRAATTCGWSPGTGRATLHWPRTSRTRRPRGDPGRATGSLSSIDRGASSWSRPTPARSVWRSREGPAPRAARLVPRRNHAAGPGAHRAEAVRRRRAPAVDARHAARHLCRQCGFQTGERWVRACHAHAEEGSQPARGGPARQGVHRRARAVVGRGTGSAIWRGHRTGGGCWPPGPAPTSGSSSATASGGGAASRSCSRSHIAQQFAPGSTERPRFPGLGGWPTASGTGRPGRPPVRFLAAKPPMPWQARHVPRGRK